MAVDTVGLLAGWKFMDHAAHLAGCLFGVYVLYYIGMLLITMMIGNERCNVSVVLQRF